MSFKDSYPDYIAIEEHIRRARVERSLAIAQMLAGAVSATWNGMKRVGAFVGRLHSARPVKGPVPSR
jgi:hypothetical protein